jgi:hypothetical protein
MAMEEPIINRVATSGLVTLDLEKDLSPPVVTSLDLAPFLVEGLVLMEKKFRTDLQALDLSPFEGKTVALFCSTDAIIPRWAWMLLASNLQAKNITSFFGAPEKAYEFAFLKQLRQNIHPEDFKGQRVVIKGCSGNLVPESAYTEVVQLLQPVVKSLMFGEPCSTVPIFKQKP